MANFKYFTDTAAGTVEAGRADYRKDGPYLWSGTEWLKGRGPRAMPAMIVAFMRAGGS